jgi:hypothetical protein
MVMGPIGSGQRSFATDGVGGFSWAILSIGS